MRALVLLGTILLATCNSAPRAVTPLTPIIVDLHQVAGRTPAEVAAVLGAPTSALPASDGHFVRYSKAVTILYRHGVADWIQVHPGNFRIGPEVLRLYGFDPPAAENPGSTPLTWGSGAVPPFAAVRMYAYPDVPGEDPSRVEYINFIMSPALADSVPF